MQQNLHFQAIYDLLWDAYVAAFPENMVELLVKNATKSSPITKDTFSFYTSIASVYSSKIEGENIALDSYIKHKFLSVTYQPDYTKKPDDLFDAYLFAKTNPLNSKNLLRAHAILSNHLLTSNKQGEIRTQQMFIIDDKSNIEFVAADAAIVEVEFEKLANDLELLTNKELTLTAIFFYASMFHLIFVKIHPLYDGNGRTSRLLEKWFLAMHLGEHAWNIEVERYYYQHLNDYYKSLRILGLEYTTLDFSKALPFTQLLLKSLEL